MDNSPQNLKQVSSSLLQSKSKTKTEVSGTIFQVDSKYKINKVKGFGAYGLVVSCFNKITSQKLAIKKVLNLFEDAVDAKRILREIKLLKFLNHQNILKLIEVLKPDSKENYQDIYIVTQLMETDLHRVIYSEQKLSKQHIQYILYQILRGVLYIHSANILHRDLKPSNILIDSRCNVKICDFGLSRGYVEQDQEMTQYVVTRTYRAPQVILRSSEYSKAIDIWSIGCILAELLGRTVLFPGSNYLDQIQKIISILGTPSEKDLKYVVNEKALKYIKSLPKRSKQAWEKVLPGYSTETYDLLSKMLTFNPDERLTVEECLNHPFFKDIHNKSQEPLADKTFDWSWDNFEPTCQKLREMIYQESLQYQIGNNKKL